MNFKVQTHALITNDPTRCNVIIVIVVKTKILYPKVIVGNEVLKFWWRLLDQNLIEKMKLPIDYVTFTGRIVSASVRRINLLLQQNSFPFL